MLRLSELVCCFQQGKDYNQWLRFVRLSSKEHIADDMQIRAATSEVKQQQNAKQATWDAFGARLHSA